MDEVVEGYTVEYEHGFRLGIEDDLAVLLPHPPRQVDTRPRRKVMHVLRMEHLHPTQAGLLAPGKEVQEYTRKIHPDEESVAPDPQVVVTDQGIHRPEKPPLPPRQRFAGTPEGKEEGSVEPSPPAEPPVPLEDPSPAGNEYVAEEKDRCEDRHAHLWTQPSVPYYDRIMVQKLVVGQLATNAYVYVSQVTGKALLIDPGADAPRIVDWLEDLGILPSALLCTHGHIDHVGAIGHLLDRLHHDRTIPVFLHEADLPLLEEAFDLQRAWLHSAGIPTADLDRPPVSSIRPLTDGKELDPWGLRLLHTPGHSPGSICLYAPEEGVLFSGDTLFREGVGRTDLPGGSWEALERSIVERLYPLGDGIRVYPGHGPETTLGHEKGWNPFVREEGLTPRG
ncbi:hypothetical protein STHERM_c16700 [Spirochaeta thermophila DSM 6192]|uniref:Metallo-beta-lactamase domain-containing protein n=2 Tax=Winmispira thermophila TaxID=154 RepID=E0RNL7_WINT6|nr:hypothetical protein STHERM_c16700 [Spirochaeta thermophila DSM 6192]